MDEKFLYTIVIPHYNIPKLLKRCLSSIPNRDDLQVLVVDDNSKEEVIVELKKLEEEFPYVTFLYSTVNGGGGKARNVGLLSAKGKYVLFADADDFFNYCIDDILTEYKETFFDIVFFNANFIDTDTYLPAKRGATLNNAIREYEKKHDLNAFKYLFGEPWCKLVRRAIIVENGICFDEIPINNDTMYSYMVGYYAKNVIFDNRAIYCLADRSGSVSKGLTDEKWRVRTDVFAKKNRFMADHNIPYFDKLMLTPFLHYAKDLDRKNFEQCLIVSKKYGYGRMCILKKLTIMIITNIMLRIRNMV